MIIILDVLKELRVYALEDLCQVLEWVSPLFEWVSPLFVSSAGVGVPTIPVGVSTIPLHYSLYLFCYSLLFIVLVETLMLYSCRRAAPSNTAIKRASQTVSLLRRYVYSTSDFKRGKMIGRKYGLILATFCSLLLWSSATFAQIYTWVDENGRKHFGDKIPTKYQSKSEAIDLKETNTTSLKESSNSISGVLGNRNAETPVKEKEPEAPEKKDAPSKQKKEKKSECSVQFAKYKESQRCYSSCINSGGGINKSKCAHCTDVPRPHCNLVY